MTSFEQAMEHVLEVEGGMSLHPKDPGNWTSGVVGVGELKGTNFGISAASYPNLNIANLTREDAIEIYRVDFWLPLGANNLEARLALLAVDASVNHGLSRAKRWLRDHPTFHAFLAHRLRFYARLSTFTTFGRGWVSRIASVLDAISSLPNPILPVSTLHIMRADGGEEVVSLDPDRPARAVGTKLYTNERG